MQSWTLWRPDLTTRTGVIEPFSPFDAINKVRAAIPGFVSAVRPQGPSMMVPPSPTEIAAAAESVAVQFARGKGARVRIGREAKVLVPNRKPTGMWGQIWAAAKASAAGQAALVKAPGQPTAVSRPVARPHGNVPVQARGNGYTPDRPTVPTMPAARIEAAARANRRYKPGA